MAHVAERLADWAAESRSRPLEAEVLHHAKRAVIDWHAAYYPGSVVPPATLLEKAFSLQDARTRALIMGSAAHTAEVDDIFRDGIYHPGAPTISAALAVAKPLKLSGMDFLRAVVVGYEISTRIGAAMGRAHYKHWHNTGTIGCFGAASAVSEILQLNKQQFAHALATVTTFAAGLQQAWFLNVMRPMCQSRPKVENAAPQSGSSPMALPKPSIT